METHPYPDFTRAMKLAPVGHVAVLPAAVVIIIYRLTTLVRAAMAMVAMVATLQYTIGAQCVHGTAPTASNKPPSVTMWGCDLLSVIRNKFCLLVVALYVQ